MAVPEQEEQEMIARCAAPYLAYHRQTPFFLPRFTLLRPGTLAANRH